MPKPTKQIAPLPPPSRLAQALGAIKKASNKRRGQIAAAFSWLWGATAIIWTFHGEAGWAIPKMDPNEWGDWAAGVAAPLAFLWLVVGYLQQGEELDANAKSLSDSLEKQSLL